MAFDCRTAILGITWAWLPPTPAGPTVDQMLSIRPLHLSEVKLGAVDRAGLKIESSSDGRPAGWILKDAGGRTLRRFLDSNRDNVVDLWCYYLDGVEVYRDIDSNSNGRADQHRWLNSLGTRWAIDTNEDGRIDDYRVLSVEEATQEAVQSLATKDFGRLSTVLASSGDLASGSANGVRRDMLSRLRNRFDEEVSRLSHFDERTRWVRFDGGTAQLIPGDVPDGSRDVTVYRDASIVVQSGDRFDILRVAELVQVGRVWKLSSVPTLVAEDRAEPAAPGVPRPAPVNTEPRQQEFLAALQRIDEQLMRTVPADPAFARLHIERAAAIEKLVGIADASERREWLRQLGDSLIVGCQSGLADADTQIDRFLSSVRSSPEAAGIESYVRYRRLHADFARRMQDPKGDFTAIQKGWITGLEQFVQAFPKSDEASDALLQMAIGIELTGQETTARPFYQRVVTEHPKSIAAKRASGALRRFDLVGTPIQLLGSDLRQRSQVDMQSLRGKTVVVFFWATWCEPCKTDLHYLKRVHDTYRSRGFEIVCVNVDSDRDRALKYISTNELPWPQLHESGGIDGGLAAQFGIVSLPTILLVDPRGIVVNRNLRVTELEGELQRLVN